MNNKFKNIILLGEVHGTEGNLWALQAILDEINIKYKLITIALELPTHWNDALQELNNGDESELLKLMQDSEELESGRISETHIKKYLELVKQGIKFVSIRENHNDWNTTDEVMAENIVKEGQKSEVLIATLGNLHTQKLESPALWDECYICHPVGETLKDKATSILIRYTNTKYINFGVVGETTDTECGPTGVIKSDIGGSDYSICIRDSGIV